MKRIIAVTLGIVTAIGGFVDIGDFVASSQAGARFGMSLAWVLVVGVVGICAYAEMAGRVTTISNRPVFGLIRERLGPRVALANLVASFLVTLITLGAEMGGVALALELGTSVNCILTGTACGSRPSARFSSGAVEEEWGPDDLPTMRANVLIGFPTGGLLSLGIMATAATVFRPLQVQLNSVGQAALPVALGVGKLGLAASSWVSSPRSARRWRPACHRPTPSRSTSAGSGASWSRSDRPHASTRSSC